MDSRRPSAGIKILVVGDTNTGKSCMLRRFVHGDFLDSYKRTIGAEFLEKDLGLQNPSTLVRLMLWDMAGSDVFNTLTQSYYQGAGAAIITFSSVDRASFGNVESWKQRIESVCGPITIVLCQTKFDLFQQSAIGNEESEQLAMRLKIPFFRTSTKDDFNVGPLFEFTAQRCVEMWYTSQSVHPQPAPTTAQTSQPLYTPASAPVAVPLAATATTAATALPAPSAAATTTTAPAAVPNELPPAQPHDAAEDSGRKKKKKKNKDNEKSKCVTM